MKWIYNPNAIELVNTDTGSMFRIVKNYSKGGYDAWVWFDGPPAGYEDGTVSSTLFSGTEPECQAYLRDLAGKFDAFALPEGNGTPRPKAEPNPEPRHVPADYSDIPF